MDKTDWLLIKALYNHKSMAKAADDLFLSQPAVSYRMARMEKEFNQTLFSRTNRGIQLTSAGLRLHTFSSLMLQYDDYIYEQVRRDTESLSGLISLGTTTNFLSTYLGDQLKEFHKLYPGISFQIQTFSSNELYKKIISKQLMLCIIRGQNDWTGPSVELFDEPLILISSEPITDELIYTKPMILNSTRTAATKPIDEWTREFFGDQPPLISPFQLSGDSIALKALVKQGFGWAVISQTRLKEDDHLYWKPIYHKTGGLYHYKTHLIYSSECNSFDTYQAYILHITEYFERLKAQQRSGMKLLSY